MSTLLHIPTNQILASERRLRNVDTSDPQYAGIRDSIRVKGIINPISVRQRTNETGGVYYELIDGLHRFSAALEVGLGQVPCHVMEADDSAVLELQIIGNLHKVETKRHQYAAQLKRLLELHPTWTTVDLASKIGASSAYVANILSLTKIKNADIGSLIDSGTINASNAYALSKLAEEDQAAFVQEAATMPADEFAEKVANRLKEVRDAKRTGAKPQEPVFQPCASLRKLQEVKDAREQGLFDADTLDWVMHLDKDSVDIQRAEFEQKMAAAAAAREKKKAEKAAKAAEAMAEAE